MTTNRSTHRRGRRARVAAILLLGVPALIDNGSGAASATPVFAHVALLTNSSGQVEPSIATDPTDINRAYVMNRQPGVPVASVWTTANLQPGAADPPTAWAHLTTVTSAQDVETTVGPDGVAYFLTSEALRVRRGGVVLPEQDVPGDSEDRQWLVAANDKAYAIWANFGVGGFLEERFAPFAWNATDGKYELIPPVRAVTSEQFNRAGQIARGRTDSELYFAYQGADAVMVARRPTPDVGRWPVSPAGRTPFVQSFPVTAVDGKGYVYVTWSDGQQVYLAVSTNLGQSFEVRTDVLEFGHSGTFATLAVMPSGAIAIAYYDTPTIVNSAAALPTTPWTLRVAMHPEPSDFTNSGWTHAQVSEGVVHTGGISARPRQPCGVGHAGLLNGMLLDNFEIALTANGRIVAAYPKETDTANLSNCQVDMVVSYQPGGPALS